MESSVMKEAWDEIERLSQDPKTVEIALSREFFLRDQLQREEDALNKGHKIGKEEGREEAKVEVILSLYGSGISVQKIAEATTFSIEKVEKIIENKFK